MTPMGKLRLMAAVEIVLFGIAVFFFVLDRTGGPEGIASRIRYSSWIREYRQSHNVPSEPGLPGYDEYVGFLTVEGTSIEYPVMRDPDDSDGEYYYLTHNFEGDYDPAGCPFIRHSAGIDDDIVEVFAHNNSNGTMFADLIKFEDEEFFNEYGGIVLDTTGGKRSYKVIAVLDVSVDSDDYSFFGWQNFPDEESEAEFQSQIHSLSRVTDDVFYPPGTQYLLLITCEYSHANGRRIVVAVRTS